MSDSEQAERLGAIGVLLNQAIDLADRSEETLLAAHIAQALACLEDRMATQPPVADRPQR